MMQGFFERGGESLKNSYIICTSWIKHYLYDARAKFDIFSGYESNLIFLAFLHFKGLLKVNNEDQALPLDWLDISKPIENVSDFFLDFL